MPEIVVRRNAILQEQLSRLPPLLQRIYCARGVKRLEELSAKLQQLLPYQSLKGIGLAADIISKAIVQQKRLLIIGDYDSDGATSTALALRALNAFGACFVDYLIPSRFDHGYGLSPQVVNLASDKNPDVIITVDNGISSVEGVAMANDLNITVVITDHHLAGQQLPKASAIVNPNQPGDNFASKNLAGVGVLFYVMAATRAKLRQQQWFEKQKLTLPNMAVLLDLVALGTVADMVALDHNNRILVYQGLQRIRAGQCVLGIQALAAIANRKLSRLSASDLGFAIAPRLNAAGRLEDMSLGVECLLADNMEKAHHLALQLDELNQKRRFIEEDMQKQAILIVKKLSFSDRLPSGLCLFDKHWHQGVIGLLASRIKNKLHRPVIAFAMDSDSSQLKGSARSVAGINIRDILAAIDTNHPNMITRFGGHAMAAGLTLAHKHFKAFAAIFAKTIDNTITQDELQGQLLTDGNLSCEQLTLETAILLERAGPWGQAFPEPRFDGRFIVLSQYIVGNQHLKLSLQSGKQVIDAIMFFVDTDLWPKPRCREISLVYKLAVNYYQDSCRLQLIVEHATPIIMVDQMATLSTTKKVDEYAVE